MLAGPVKPERRAPVVQHQGHARAQFEFIEKRAQVAIVIGEAVRSGPGIGQLVRLPHADQVRRNTSAVWHEVRQHVPPEIRRRGIAVQENDRIAGTFVRIRERPVEYLYALHYHFMLARAYR